MAKILLVEDDKSLREIYGVCLQAEGYTIISAGDGEEALAVAIKERPDLIVSDVMMPKISGFDMLDILRSTTETKDIKVIMMTALSSEDQRARGEALGADRYLVKSQVGIEDVVRTVHDVLGDGVPGAASAPGFSATPAPAPAAAPVAEPVAPAPLPQPTPAPIAAAAPIAAPAPVAAPVIAPAPVVFPEPAPALAPAPAPQFAVEPIAAPVEQPVAAQPVAPVAPVAAPTPIAPDPVYAPAPEPTAAPVAPQPVAAPIAPAPAAAPVAAPVAPTPAAPANPFTAPSTLPEPTAPFSTNGPASLAERIINPLPSADTLNNGNVSDLAHQMNQELNAQVQAFEQTAAPAAPAVPPAAPQGYTLPPNPPQPGA